METLEIRKISDSVVLSHETGYSLKMHDRPRSSMILTERGKIIYEFGTVKLLSDSSSVLFLPKGATYGLKCIEGGIWYMIDFEGSMEKKFPFCIEVGESRILYENFFSILKSGSQYKKLSLFYDILDKINRENKDLKIPETIRPQVYYIKENYGNPEINNNFLSRMTNISEVYFRRLFSLSMGVPPMTYLRRLRIDHAKRYLKEHSMSIDEIARLCGYGSQYYFSTAFKKETGVSPSEYSKLHSSL